MYCTSLGHFVNCYGYMLAQVCSVFSLRLYFLDNMVCFLCYYMCIYSIPVFGNAHTLLYCTCNECIVFNKSCEWWIQIIIINFHKFPLLKLGFDHVDVHAWTISKCIGYNIITHRDSDLGWRRDTIRL